MAIGAKDSFMTIATLTLWGLSLAALSSALVEPKHQVHATPHRTKSRGHAGCSTNGQVYRYVRRSLAPALGNIWNA